MSKAVEKPKKYEELLMSAFDLVEDDLEANRQGEVSPRQVSRLRSARNTTIGTFAALVLLCMFITLVIAGAGLGISGVLPPLFAGVVASGALYFIYGRKARHLFQDIHENSVAIAEGRVHLNFNPHQNTAEYFILVEGTKFRIGKKEMFLAIKNGDPYRIYYAPRSKVILSIEWLRENDDNLMIMDADDTQEMADGMLTIDEYAVEEKAKHQSE